MSDKQSGDRPYEHSGRTVGGSPGPDPSTEHRDTARGNPSQLNDIRPEERAEQDGYGPRTHPATRTTRKDED